MEKIKSVLHGHKKSGSQDVASNSPTSSSTAEGQQHPIYDQMTGQKETHATHAGEKGYLSEPPHYNQAKTVTGEPYTALGHGQSEQASTATTSGHTNIGTASHAHDHSHTHDQSTNQTHAKDGGEASIVPLKIQEKLPESVERAVPNAIHDTGDSKRDHTTTHGGQSTTNNPSTFSGAASRPDTHPTGKALNTGVSDASIKSGVIGFGPGEHQGHAAISTHNPTEQYLDQKQVVGGGEPGTAGQTEGKGLSSGTSAQPYSQSGTSGQGVIGQAVSTQDHSGINPSSATTQQPYENTLRQESYTADTDRSFPLAGGVTSKHPTDHTSSARHPTQSTDQSSSTYPTATSEREPGTKEREISAREGHDNHGREGLAGAAAAATGIGASKALSRSDEKDVQHQGLSTHQPIAGDSTGVHDTHGQKGLIGGTAAPSAVGASQSPPLTEDRGLQSQGLGTSQNTYGDQTSARETHDHGHGREGLAAGALGATAIGASQSLPRSDERDTRTHGQDIHPTTHSDEGRSKPGLLEKAKAAIGIGSSKTHSSEERHGDLPSSTTAGPTSGTAQGPHPDALAAATAAAALSGSKSSTSPSTHGQGYGAQDRNLSGTTQTSNTPVSQSYSAGATTGDRPLGGRNISYRHVPGGYPSPTPDESRTFLDYTSVIEPTPTSGLTSGHHSTGAHTGSSSTTVPTGSSSAGVPSGLSSTDVSTGQHELRHTGSLNQPQSKTSELADDHHHGRDAGIAGGIGAGAAGLAYAASKKHDSSNVDNNKPLYEEASPYSSKTLDPRVLGDKSRLEEQRFDPQTKTETSPHHAAQTSNPVGISSASNPLTSHEPTRTEAPQHNYGRDATLVGAGAATGAGLHHAHQRNDAPGTGTSVLPQDSPYMSPSSSSATASIPQHGLQQRSVAQEPEFYGTAGAPAPFVEGKGIHHEQPLSNVGSTPTSSSTAGPEKDSQHHYGRDAALAGGAAATAGGLYAANRDTKTETGPASNTVGPHSSNAANVLDPRVQPDPAKQVHHSVGSTSQDPASRTVGPHDSNIANILDPRVQPDPAKQKAHTTTGPHQSDTLNRLDPKVDEKAGHQSEHHYGRDAAVVGGTGAAGYGAYEAAKAYGDHRSTQPGASMNEQRYDPTASGAIAPNPVAAKSEYNYNDPSATSNVNRTALGTGAGLGATGLAAGAYAGSKHADNSQSLPLHQKQDVTSSAQPGSVTQPSYPTSGTIAPQNTHDPSQGSSKDHDTRNAALLGTAGAAAAGGAAYGVSQKHDADHERAKLEKEQQERLKKEAHDREKEQHRLDKDQAKHDKEVHKHDKAVAAHAKEEHRLEKEHSKEVAAHEKEQARLAKEEHKREKEADKEARVLEKEHEGEGKKKGGLFGFLHRDKSKKEKTTGSPDSSPRQSRDYSPRHSKEYAAAGTVGALGAGTTAAAYDDDHPDSPRWKGKNLLHKDPPVGHPARDALEGDLQSGKREHIGIDGPIGDPHHVSGDRETRPGVYGAHGLDESRVIEPTTGLPMNVEKFGPGIGGTDGNTNIHGYQNVQGQHGSGAQGRTDTHGVGGSQGLTSTHGVGGNHGVTGSQNVTSTAPGQTGTGTDWAAIKKADTPY